MRSARYLMPGSSPLVRGARSLIRACGWGHGIIPARAGSTPQSTVSNAIQGDHPRSCGEHPAERTSMTPLPGSSPLVRGAPASVTAPAPTPGIIPARAGSTQRTARSMSGAKDHPRSCGEHPAIVAVLPPAEGSSPLVRGAQRSPGPYRVGAGIIPARAGSTV